MQSLAAMHLCNTPCSNRPVFGQRRYLPQKDMDKIGPALKLWRADIPIVANHAARDFCFCFSCRAFPA